jgi:hypothetical protein
MAVEIKSNQITGITSVSNYSDAANKIYVDVTSGITTTSDDGSRLFVYSDGSTQSWEPIGAYQEYTSSGQYTFTVPLQAKELFIEATGAGGGGASGNTDDSSFINNGIYWAFRFNSTRVVNTLMYGGGYYVYGSGLFTTGTQVGGMQVSADTVTWTTRTSSNINGIYSSVYKTSADNPYVVGGYGTPEWTIRTGTTNTLRSAMYDGTNFFAGGDSGTLIASTDSITWIARNSGFGGTAINALTYGTSYVAGGAFGTLTSSADGITWNLRTAAFGTNAISSIIFASGQTNPYVAGGVGGIISVSTDTISWTLRTSGNTAQQIYGIAFNNSITEKYVAVRNTNALSTSTNGIQWTLRTSGFTTSDGIYSVLSYSNGYIAGNNVGAINTSTNGIQWTRRTSGSTSPIYSIIFENQIYVAASGLGESITSTDTIIWSPRDSGFGIAFITAVAYGNNTYINVGSFGRITVSTQSILSTYGQGAYLAVSSDTITWTLRTAGTNTQNITALASNSNFYVAGNSNSISLSNIIVSTDSINWVVRTSPFSSTVNSITYDGTLYFVGGSQSGQCAVSSDTIIWILRTTAFGSGANSVQAVAYGLVESTPTYVVTGGNIASGGVTILSASTDTITWTLRTAGSSSSAFSLGYNSGIFMLGISNSIFSSTDTITWTLRTSNWTSGGNGSPNAIVYGASGWVAGGSGGTVGTIVAAPNPGGFAGSGGGGGATVSWNISKAYITGSSLTVNVGQGGSAGQAGAASIVSWTGNSGTYALTANGGSGGSNVYNPTTLVALGGSGGAIPSVTSNYLTATAGTSGGNAGLFGSTFQPTVGTDATTGFQATGGGGGNYTGGTAKASGIIYYYNNTTSAAAGAGATAISGLSYGNGGGGGAAGSAGGSGVKGGGGGGGGYNSTTDTVGTGGTGGNGYVRISWQ